MVYTGNPQDSPYPENDTNPHEIEFGCPNGREIIQISGSYDILGGVGLIETKIL